jgi:hypothetical protein
MRVRSGNPGNARLDHNATTGRRNVRLFARDDPKRGRPQRWLHEWLPAQRCSRRKTAVNFNPMPVVAAWMLALGTVMAHADTTIDQYVTFSGFGTLGVVHSDYGQADFIGRVDQDSGAGYGSKWSVTPDSDLGVQANVTLTRALSAVVQVIARDEVDGSYTPNIEWANLNYQFTPDLGVRVGRMLLPSYQHSESQNVGYTLPWVRVPSEISYTDTAEHSDGLDVLYRLKTGVVDQQLQVQWGTTTENLPGLLFNDTRAHILLLGDTLQYGDTSVHLVYQQFDASHYPPIGFRLVSAGFTYDPGAWFVTGDSSYTKDTFFGDFFGWYLSGGMRLGRFTPYAIYSTTEAPSTGTSGLMRLGEERTVSAGVRWDFVRNFDFKLQLQQVTILSLDDPASFANVQPGARVGDKANVLSLALDFVF